MDSIKRNIDTRITQNEPINYSQDDRMTKIMRQINSSIRFMRPNGRVAYSYHTSQAEQKCNLFSATTVFRHEVVVE